MSRLAIHAAPHSGDQNHYETGDVIVVMPDDHRWSDFELANPDWRFVDFPGEPVAKFLHLVVDARHDPVPGSPLMRRRTHHLHACIYQDAQPHDVETMCGAHIPKHPLDKLDGNVIVKTVLLPLDEF